jgi:hypothetical protein
MIQAWALEQDSSSRWDFMGSTIDDKSIVGSGAVQQDLLVPWKLQRRFFFSKQSYSDVSQPEVEGEKVDCNHAIRQEDGSLLFQRYCHVFKHGELEDLSKR